MLSLFAMLIASVYSPQLVVREPLAPTSVQTTVTSQCGEDAVLIRIERTQGRIGSRVTHVEVGDVHLSNLDLKRLKDTIASRDIVSASVVQCGGEVNLDEVEIIFSLVPREGSPSYVGLTIANGDVRIETA